MYKRKVSVRLIIQECFHCDGMNRVKRTFLYDYHCSVSKESKPEVCSMTESVMINND
jgi:hypothetical protein